MKRIPVIFDVIDKILSAISAVTLFIMMLWIFCDVILRFFFNSPIQGTIELTGEYLMVLLVYLALSDTYKHDEHVKVTFLENKFPENVKKVLKFVTSLFAAAFFFLIGILNFQEGVEYYEQNIMSSGVLNYPLAPALFIIAIGLFMIALRLVLECIGILFPKIFHTDESAEKINKALNLDA